jgi:hypothetical protein
MPILDNPMIPLLRKPDLCLDRDALKQLGDDGVRMNALSLSLKVEKESMPERRGRNRMDIFEGNVVSSI